MAGSGAALEEEIRGEEGLDSGWSVVLFNCSCHSFDEVERVLTKATRCTLSQARAWSWEVHSRGSAVVYRSARERCEAVADVIAAIGLNVKVCQ